MKGAVTFSSLVEISSYTYELFGLRVLIMLNFLYILRGCVNICSIWGIFILYTVVFICGFNILSY
jgi:hypothetical protein